MKIETITEEIEHCGECTESAWVPTKKDEHRYKCLKVGRVIPGLWGEIPSWCPLEEGK